MGHQQCSLNGGWEVFDSELPLSPNAKLFDRRRCCLFVKHITMYYIITSTCIYSSDKYYRVHVYLKINYVNVVMWILCCGHKTCCFSCQQKAAYLILCTGYSCLQLLTVVYSCDRLGPQTSFFWVFSSNNAS